MRVDVKPSKDLDHQAVGSRPTILKPLVGPIRLFHRLAGFPINAEDEDGAVFSLKKSTYAFYFLLVASSMFAFMTEYGIIIFIYGIQIKELFAMIPRAGVAITDVYTIQMLYFYCIGFNFVMAYFFKGADEKLAKFSSDAANVDYVSVSQGMFYLGILSCCTIYYDAHSFSQMNAKRYSRRGPGTV